MSGDYVFGKTVQMPHEEAVARATEALGKEGFGVLNEIDVAATLKKKLDVTFRRYVILGACNPTLAHRALQAEPQIGLLLPCNVVVQEAAGGGVTVSIADPNDSLLELSTPSDRTISALRPVRFFINSSEARYTAS